MSSVSLAKAKAQLSALIERAVSGEHVSITRRGKPVAQLIATKPARQRVDAAALHAMTSAMPAQKGNAASLVRGMRDEERY